MRILAVVVVILLLTVGPALAAGKLQILVVGDGQGGEQAQREKELSDQLVDLRKRAGLQEKALPMVAYHFNKADERSYCEGVLHIKHGDLLFAGLVESQGDQDRVVFRVGSVADPSAAAMRVMREALGRLGMDASVLGGGTTSSGLGGTVSYRRGYTFQNGSAQTRFNATDEFVGVNVLLHNDTPGQSHSHTLTVSLTDEGGRAVDGSTLGGQFTVAAGENIDDVNMLPRASGRRVDGYNVRSWVLGKNPGRYTAVVSLDGRIVGQVGFEVVQARPQGVSFMRVMTCATGESSPRTTFFTTDTGLIVAVYLRNDNLVAEHRHSLQVYMLNEQGNPWGARLGGPFVVAAGESLDNTDMLRRADVHHYNGWRLAGYAVPGRYQVVVELDGQVVGRSQFTIMQK